MDRSAYLEQWSTLHGGARTTGVIGGWLRVVHAAAWPLVRLRVPPDAVTLLGLAVALAAYALAGQGRAGVALAVVVVVLSGLVDSLDGAVAVMTGRVTRWGAVLDGVVDRLSDAVLVAALWRAGAPAPACVAAVAVAWLHEYVRARAQGAGMAGVGVLTPAERPTRVIIVAAFLLAAALRPTEPWATFGVWALVGLGLVSLVILLVVVRRALSGPSAEPGTPLLAPGS